MKKNHKNALIIGLFTVVAIAAVVVYTQGEQLQGMFLPPSPSYSSMKPSGITLQKNPHVIPYTQVGVPQITSDIPVPGIIKDVSSHTVMHRFIVTAKNGTVRFSDNGSSSSGLSTAAPEIYQLASNEANQIVLKLVSTGPILAGATCDLIVDNPATPPQLLSTASTIQRYDAPYTEYLAFRFGFNDLEIEKDSSAELEVQCDTVKMLAPASPGAILSAVLPSHARTVEWGTAGSTDVTGRGAEVVPVNLDGYSVQNP